MTVLRAVTEALGADIRPHQLRAMMSACAYVVSCIPDGIASIGEGLTASGALNGPTRKPVLRAWLTGLGEMMKDNPWNGLGHLVPASTLDADALQRWRVDLNAGLSVVASILQDDAPGSEPLVRGVLESVFWLGSTLEASSQWELLLPAFWRAGAQTWAAMAHEHVRKMAHAMSRFRLRNAQVGWQTLPTAGVRSDLLACALSTMRPPPRPVDLDQTLKHSRRIDRLAGRLGWCRTQDLRDRKAGAQPEAASLSPDVGDEADPADWIPQCRRLLDRPLDALTALPGEERFELLSVLCALRRVGGLPAPDLEREVSEDLRDAVLLRLPRITPWAMTAREFERLHACFMDRIRTQRGWLSDQLSVAGLAGAPTAAREVTELLDFYESFLQAYGLALSSEDIFAHHTPEHARRKALALSAALNRMVQPQRPAEELHWFERRQIAWFRSVLERLRPLLGRSEALSQAVAAVREAVNAARQDMAIDELRRRFVDPAQQPARGVQEAIAECLAQGTPREDVAALACGLLPALVRGPREGLAKRLQIGIVRPLLEAEQLHGDDRSWVLSRVTSTLEAGDAGWRPWVDAVLDPEFALDDSRRLILFGDLAVSADLEAAQALREHIDSLGDMSAPLSAGLRDTLAQASALLEENDPARLSSGALE